MGLMERRIWSPKICAMTIMRSITSCGVKTFNARIV